MHTRTLRCSALPAAAVARVRRQRWPSAFRSAAARESLEGSGSGYDAPVLRWRNLLILFVIDDVLYVLSAATINNKHQAGTASHVFLGLFVAGVVLLVGGIVAMLRSSRTARSDG
jgi:hypothetical protein